VAFVSSIIAHISPVPSGEVTPSMREGVLVRPSRPRASARRRAGSIVTTTDRRPARAADMAMTAADVVLPTPPDPQQITTELWSTTSANVLM
jgi:hypothetical protein